MTKRQNRFEKHSKTITAVLYSLIGLTLLVGTFFLVKAGRDEIKRGGERYIQLREPRPFQDHSSTPGAETLKFSVGLEKKPYRMQVDEDGFIQPSKIHDAADRSIVFLGGSTTEGQFVDEDARFPYLAGRILEKNLGLKINSYNTAKSGNNSLHSLFILQSKIIPLHPTVAVIMECVNELNFLIHLGDYYRQNYSRGIIVNKEYNFIKNYLLSFKRGKAEDTYQDKDEFALYRGEKPKRSIEEMCELYKKNLELFIFICRQHDITPVLMTQFNALDPDNAVRFRDIGLAAVVEDKMGMPFARYCEYYRAMNNVHRVVAAQQNVLLIDLDKFVPKTAEYLYDGVHLNGKGSKLTAEIVAKGLEPILR